MQIVIEPGWQFCYWYPDTWYNDTYIYYIWNIYINTCQKSSSFSLKIMYTLLKILFKRILHLWQSVKTQIRTAQTLGKDGLFWIFCLLTLIFFNIDMTLAGFLRNLNLVPNERYTKQKIVKLLYNQQRTKEKNSRV